jgi:hypothetical protein
MQYFKYHIVCIFQNIFNNVTELKSLNIFNFLIFEASFKGQEAF